MYVKIIPSKRKDKRLSAIFFDKDRKLIKITHFGLKGGSTYIDHKDIKKRNAYEARHKVNENFNDYKSAGSLAYYILWSYTDFEKAKKEYSKKFGLKLI